MDKREILDRLVLRVMQEILESLDRLDLLEALELQVQLVLQERPA